jgi:hypothetical protein
LAFEFLLDTSLQQLVFGHDEWLSVFHLEVSRYGVLVGIEYTIMYLVSTLVDLEASFTIEYESAVAIYGAGHSQQRVVAAA